MSIGEIADSRFRRLCQAGPYDSQGVRLAKPVLKQAGLEDEVNIRVELGAVIRTAAVSPRAGWAAAAKHGPAKLLNAPSATRFDDEAWEWR